MLRAIRRWFREESLGITIPVGVVLGLTLEMVLAQLVVGFEIGWQSNGPPTVPRRLDTAPLGIRFNYGNFLAYGIAFLVLAALAYLLFIMPIASDDEPEPDMRECPECKSDIVAEATRCAFCTSPVTPLQATPGTP